MTITYHSSRWWVASLGAAVFVLSTLAWAWSWWQWQTDLHSQTTIVPAESRPTQPVVASPATDSALSGLTGSLPSPSPAGTAPVSPSPRAAVHVSPSPSPKVSPAPTVDVTFSGNLNQPNRIFNDGSNVGWQTQAPTALTPHLTWLELSPFWSTYEDTCADVTASQKVSSKSIMLTVYVDGQKKLTSTVGDQPGVPAEFAPNGRHLVCYRSTVGAGVHQVKYVLNENRQLSESNYANNELVVTYEIKADTEAPSFTMAGPVKETEGTCFHLNDVRDNITPYSELIKENRFDSGSWSDASNRLCLTGPAGESHTYSARVIDAKGNTSEKSMGFVIQ